jgi:hypothetical protein
MLCTVELHLSGLIGTASNPDVHKIRITEIFFENVLPWQFEVENNFNNYLFRAAYLFIYVQLNRLYIIPYMYLTIWEKVKP